MNIVREGLKRNRTVLGQMVLDFFVPSIPPILAASGAEFVIFDMEHGRCDISVLANMINYCRGTQLVPIARVPDYNTSPLSRVLDLGAQGVMIPRVESKAQLTDIIAQLKYAPDGRRGVAFGIAHDDYRPRGADYLREANEQTLVIALLETAQAFEHLDEIISAPGLDVAWMGHYDLTVSMGIPAEFKHPRFLAAMDRLLFVCANHNVTPGFLVTNHDEALYWIERGFRMISMGTDLGTFGQSVRQFHSLIRGGLVSIDAKQKDMDRGRNETD